MTEPLFSLIAEKCLHTDRLVVAIDGGAASGKTTLSKRLAEHFDGAVIHMDDFFLRPEQRTPERFKTPGGNFDLERFLAEVVPHLHTALPFSYRAFDCSHMALGERVTVEARKLLIVEGSYSHHPALAPFYDLKLFLEAPMEARSARILARNGEEKYKMFLTRWIPLENTYFEAFSIRENADLIIEG